LLLHHLVLLEFIEDLWNIWNLQILKTLDWSMMTRGPSSELKSFELVSFPCTLKNFDRLRACNCTIFMHFSGLKNILKNLVSKCGCQNFHFNPYDQENTLHSFIGADILSSVRLSEWESLHKFCYCLQTLVTFHNFVTCNCILTMMVNKLFKPFKKRRSFSLGDCETNI